jgi:hypothetical protein
MESLPSVIRCASRPPHVLQESGQSSTLWQWGACLAAACFYLSVDFPASVPSGKAGDKGTRGPDPGCLTNGLQGLNGATSAVGPIGLSFNSDHHLSKVYFVIRYADDKQESVKITLLWKRTVVYKSTGGQVQAASRWSNRTHPSRTKYETWAWLRPAALAICSSSKLEFHFSICKIGTVPAHVLQTPVYQMRYSLQTILLSACTISTNK